jgi:hypothetical protein
MLVLSTIAILSASAYLAGVKYQAFAQSKQDQGTPFVVQNTSRSGPDP